MDRAVFFSQNAILIGERAHLRDAAVVDLSSETILGLRVLQKSRKLWILMDHPDGLGETAAAMAEVPLPERLRDYLAQYGISIQYLFHPEAQGDLRDASFLTTWHQIVATHQIDVPNSFGISDRLQDAARVTEVGMQSICILRDPEMDSTILPHCLIATDLWDAVLAVLERDLSQHNEEIRAEIERAVGILRGGGVVAFPTETVYGLGANALDPIAVARVFEIKGRPRFDPLIVHVATLQQMHTLVTDLPQPAEVLLRHFWPGPLTLVLPKSALVPDIVTAGLPTVAVRMPDHPIALTLIRKLGMPVAAPSANLFGRVSPTTAEHVRQQLGNRVDLILDGGACPIGLESTVVSVSGDAITLLRPGGTPLEEIERVVGPVQRRLKASATPLSPGQLPHHYAPRTPLVLKGQDLPETALRRGLLAFTIPADTEGFVAVEALSSTGDLREAAANLFAALHRLDALQLDVIVAELVPEVGLGLAINDRLRRAART